jgi:pimeloyl-ACP methyl ester carboxylesterase
MTVRPRARVVLVHGLRTSATMWRRQLATLARHDIDAVAIDLPGHGARMDEPFSLDEAMRIIGEALPPDAGTPPHAPRLLVGLSLGGYLAVEFAARHPGRIDGLVAASCSARPVGLGLAGYRQLAALIGRLPDRGRALNDLMVRLFLSREGVDDVLAGGVALDVMAPVLSAVGELDPEARRRAGVVRERTLRPLQIRGATDAPLGARRAVGRRSRCHASRQPRSARRFHRRHPRSGRRARTSSRSRASVASHWCRPRVAGIVACWLPCGSHPARFAGEAPLPSLGISGTRISIRRKDELTWQTSSRRSSASAPT